MNAILLYLVQVIVGSGILYGYYHWVLRNKEFHEYNRFYLLSAAVISLLLPLLQIPVYFENPDDTSAQVLQAIQWGGEADNVIITANGGSSFFSLSSILYYAYFLVGGLLLIRFIVALVKIAQLLRRHKIEKLEGVDFVNTEEPGTPFTFFRWLFWDRNIELDSDNGRQVFRHEVFHIQQKHSWDVMFMEVLRTLFWINPFFHLMKKELRTIHEFLADRFAINEQEKWSYAEFLLMQALETKNKLVNPFFHSQIKRRIAMITQSQKTSHRYLRKVLALPLAVLVLGLVAFQVKHEVNEATENAEPIAITLEETGVMAEEPGVMNVALNDTVPVKVKLIASTNKLTGQDSTLKLRGVNAPGKEPLFVVDGVTITATNRIRLDTLNASRIESVTVLKDASASALYGDLADNGVVIVATRAEPREFKKAQAEEKVVEVEGRSLPEVTIKPSVLELKNVVIEKRVPLEEVSIKAVGVVKADTKVGLQATRSPEDMNEVVVVGYSKNNKTQEPLFEAVEVAPQPQGGQEGWVKFLQRNLNADVAVDNNAPIGMYTVKIRFIVEKDGSVSHIMPLTMHGYGMEEEAIRVIKAAGTWIPGKQNGIAVRAFRQQPITFMVEKVEKDVKSLTLAPIKSEVSEKEIKSAGTIYPNPTDQNCTITYNAENAGSATVQIVTMSGGLTGIQKKVNLAKGNNTISLPTSSLKAGTYVVNIVVENSKGAVYKLVKN